MDAVWGFIQQYWPIILGFFGGTVLPMIFAKWLPNDTWHRWGVDAGRKLSKAGGQFFGAASWEQVENSLLGSFAAFVSGVEEGANEDDSV